jgi:hypothetical protein
LADAWDLQIQLEDASNDNKEILGALLDYEKFFDLFQPEFVANLLRTAGIPEGIAKQILFLYSRLTRYIKVADTYGAVIKQFNGIGQGCSLSIIIANLYVCTLLRFLRAQCPESEVGAFLDDRNITAKTIPELLEALEAIRKFDKAAGHCTNLNKSTVFSNSQKTRHTLRKVTVEGKELPVKTFDNMVGH